MESTARADERTRSTVLSTVLGWTGAGLIAGGVLLAAVNMVRFSSQAEELTTPDGSGRWWTALVLGGIVLWAALRRGTSADDLARGRSRIRTVLLLVTGAVCLYVAYAGFSPAVFVATAATRQDYGPDHTGVSMWVVAVTIALGTLLSAAAVERPRWRPAGRSLPPLAGGLALVLLIEVGLRAATLYQPTEHVVADTFPDAPAAVPTDVSRVGWEWEPSGEASVESVVPGPLGPLVVLGDGVLALDGASGDELWSFRQPYSAVSVDVVSGGATAVVTRLPAASRFDDRRVTEIDTATGEILREAPVPSLRSEDDHEDTHTAFLARTADLRLYEWREPGERLRLSARDPWTSDELWSFTQRIDDDRVCVADYGWRPDENLLLTEDLLVVLYACADPDRLDQYESPWDLASDPGESVTVTVTALDTATGEVAWEHAWEEAEEHAFGLATGRPTTSGEGSPPIVVESGYGRRMPRVLDARNGTTASELPPELLESETETVQAFRGLVRADADGTVLLVRDDEAWDEPGVRAPLDFHRVAPDGQTTETARLPDESVYFDNWLTATVLGDSVAVLTNKPGDGDQDRPVLSAVIVPFGAGTDAVDLVELGEERPDTDSVEELWEDRARLVPGPGAVAAYVAETESPIVYGLVD